MSWWLPDYLGSYQRGWDSGAYWLLSLPAMAVLAAASGWLQPSARWWHAAGILFPQLGLWMVDETGSGSWLLAGGLGLALYAGLTAMVFSGARLQRQAQLRGW